jgi:hypothetical protein
MKPSKALTIKKHEAQLRVYLDTCVNGWRSRQSILYLLFEYNIRITNKNGFRARDSSDILFLLSQSLAKKDTADGPTRSFFLKCLNVRHKVIKMKGLRPNNKTHLLCRKCVASFGWLPKLRHRHQPIQNHRCLPNRPAAFYFHVIACYITRSIAQ